MELGDILPFNAVLFSVNASGRKQALQEIGHRAADVYGVDCGAVIDGLLTRERLGSTAMGSGVAIPHARIAGLESIVGIFARLEKPVDFEAADGQGVDLLFSLLGPEEGDASHLRALAKVSRVLRDQTTLDKLRSADEAAALHAILTDLSASRAA